MVYRVFVEKKKGLDNEAKGLLNEARNLLGMERLENVRLFNRYDAENITEDLFRYAVKTVFSEPQLDTASPSVQLPGAYVFAVEALPGQFDQRADSAAQCIQIISQGERPLIRTAKVYALYGALTDGDIREFKKYVINPVECREASLDVPETLAIRYDIPTEVATLTGFTKLSRDELADFIANYGLAMDLDDIVFCQSYFREEGRDPTITEIRMIDTYWSDHCRHTTFGTILDHVTFEDSLLQKTYEDYLTTRNALGRSEKPICLMDLATIAVKHLKAAGKLPKLDESEEINACTVKMDVTVDGVTEPWLLLFKNETHNHPTEIEPFGGAATCIGGAIRDPLSGRSYVYGAMRVTGAADPLTPVSETIPGKLPQRKIVTTAAAGYSSYGNQIGLATGIVDEIYHPGYAAKRMEIGAVIAAAPAENVRRERPDPGDVVILLGGNTGRDGIGGATGSSKAHTQQSVETCGSEVQKGNAPEERKLQRLFRNPEAARMIKRCNDFGAGGVSVAIGGLADSLDIDLDAVPKKYEGLDGTELAISESQERMAVVLDEEKVARFLELAATENLQGTPVAKVTATGRMRMVWRGKTIVDLSREFLGSNGAPKHVCVRVTAPAAALSSSEFLSFGERLRRTVTDLNVCSQKGLVERFDSSIGGNTVLSPFGGRWQETPAQAMAAKIPVTGGETNTASIMAYGFDPTITDPYASAVTAVSESIAKVVAAGGSRKRCWLSFQEYFERLRRDETRWVKPLASLLGALDAQLALECGAIGGKDSMSGSFEHIDVPPTLVSFAVSTADAANILSPEFERAGSQIGLMMPAVDQNGVPDLDSVRQMIDGLEKLIAGHRVRAAWVCEAGGIAEGLFKMSLGNRIGVTLCDGFSDDFWFERHPAAVIISCDEIPAGVIKIAETVDSFTLTHAGRTYDLAGYFEDYANRLAPVYPYRLPTPKTAVPAFTDENASSWPSPAVKTAKPRVLLPVFAGTNCEYDSTKAFERAGAHVETRVFRNMTAEDIRESVEEFEKSIAQAQIIMFPGGFSAGDEPDGSAKFFATAFQNAKLKEAVMKLLNERDGLALGICNGFQALIKLGLVPYGEITGQKEDSPTLTFNTINRHISKMVYTKVVSNKSPWLQGATLGATYCNPASHGEGRFVAPKEWIDKLFANGQVATQYADQNGNVSMDEEYNINGSYCAIEGITSPDGRCFGKMAHSERRDVAVAMNIYGEQDMKIFESGVQYFK